MNIKRKLIIMLLFAFSFILLHSNMVFAKETWNSLNYDVTLNQDGSADIIEKWEIYISEANTLFKTFDDKSKIENVKVSLMEEDKEIPLEQVNEWQYHVNEGCYYGEKNPDGNFEIGWYVGLENDYATRKYQISYKVIDAVNIHNDCTEFYWKFLNDQNNISGENITGQIHLPNGISDIEKLRVWAHGNLNGQINRTSTNLVNFSIPEIDSKEMVEVRIVTEENIYPTAINKTSKDMLATILEEEQKWADEANKIREKNAAIEKTIKIVEIIIAIFFGLKVFKALRYMSKIKNTYPKYTYEMEYFREIPNEDNATPARALYITNYKKDYDSIETSKAFSASILDFCLKKVLKMEINSIGKIILTLDKNIDPDKTFTPDEAVVYNILLNASRGRKQITIDDLNAYIKGNGKLVYNAINLMTRNTEKYLKDEKFIDEERLNTAKNIEAYKMIYVYIAILFLIFAVTLMSLWLFIIASLSFTCSRIYSITYKNFSALTEKGYEEQANWKGLIKYMNDYSLLKEKTAPDIVLWEKFLVYATVFGISEKVIKQLKVVHPEMFEEKIPIEEDDYWKIIRDSRFNILDITNMSNSISNTYNQSINSSLSSSGSGSGGGFSSGGGGGSGGGSCGSR